MDNVKYCNQKYPNQSSGSKNDQKVSSKQFFPLIPRLTLFLFVLPFLSPKKKCYRGSPCRLYLKITKIVKTFILNKVFTAREIEPGPPED